MFEYELGILTCRCLLRMELFEGGWCCGSCGVVVIAEAAAEFYELRVSQTAVS